MLDTSLFQTDHRLIKKNIATMEMILYIRFWLHVYDRFRAKVPQQQLFPSVDPLGMHN